MPILQTAILNYRQFRNLHLDFRDPATGQALEKVCFIGTNGTGKSTLLSVLAQNASEGDWSRQEGRFLQEERRLDQEIIVSFAGTAWPEEKLRFGTALNALRDGPSASGQNPPVDFCTVPSRIWPLLWCQPEAEAKPDFEAMARVSLNEALPFAKGATHVREPFHMVDQSTVAEFWKRVVGVIKRRESDYLEFLKAESSQRMSVDQARAEFERSNPEFLEQLAKLWDRILEPCGLEFDYKGAKVPVQLTDNIQAYIRLKKSGQKLEWSDLSTGIRLFLFRVGHIFTFYLHGGWKGGVLLVDEPESSLHPDFLYDLVSLYQEVAPGAQLFMATHSPIIAAQFRPEERFVLEFQDDGSVAAHRGICPEGDDPNDLLRRDFKVSSLYGAKGVEMWERFLSLRRDIRTETDPSKREAMMAEYLKIGKDYNFAPDALPLQAAS